jgi:putative nucleotidyltransferase with HDIG domain
MQGGVKPDRAMQARRYVRSGLIRADPVPTIEKSRLVRTGTHHIHTVLVVDDDPQVRGMLTSAISSFGYDVEPADCAEAAVEAMQDRPRDVAVCDVNMPGHDGVWLASQIRQHHPHTAVIMATGGRDIGHTIVSLRNEVVDYLFKPFDNPRLREALQLGIDWHRSMIAADEFQESLEHRLRSRRKEVAAALAGVQETVEDALEGLLAMLELHTQDTRDHAWRVARMAGAIADEIGIDPGDIGDVQRGALLHDIGKIDMPHSILYKPAPLNDQEWSVMRTHPRVGYDMLKKVPSLEGAAEIVLSSHEAFNGSGYPRGLRGENIPLGARILSIADSYDSMTRPHTQRPPMPPAHAMAEIERCSGTQFDPQVVEALADVLIQTSEDSFATSEV